MKIYDGYENFLLDIYSIRLKGVHLDKGTEGLVVYFQQRLVYECLCDERLNVKTERSTRLSYTVLCGGLEHLKIETRLITERFANEMGECVMVINGLVCLLSIEKEKVK
jgi:hypothetical protein